MFFRFRTRMVDFSENFKNGFDGKPCQLCQLPNTVDNEQHFLKCDKISNNVADILTVKEDKLFATNYTIDPSAIKILIKALKKRKLLMTK